MDYQQCLNGECVDICNTYQACLYGERCTLDNDEKREKKCTPFQGKYSNFYHIETSLTNKT